MSEHTDFTVGEEVVTPRGVGIVEHTDIVSGVTVRFGDPDGEAMRYNPEQLQKPSARRAALAADLRRLAHLAESGLLDGEHIALDVHVDSAARVQVVVDALGGEVRRYRSHTETVQASTSGAYVGSVQVVALVNTDAPWDSDSDETWAALVQDGAAINGAVEFRVGDRYMYDGMLVEVTVIDGDQIEFRAVHDQEAIARSWFPTSYDTYEASMSIADFRTMVDGGSR
ncbi:hypothetical protein GCM10027059_26940 [Myceligenerans halotolerans]